MPGGGDGDVGGAYEDFGTMMADSDGFDGGIDGNNAAERLGVDMALQRAFKKYDADGSGKVSLDELSELCAELGQELSEAELKAAMEALDADGSGQVEFSEFSTWWMSGSIGGGGEAENAVVKKLNEAARRGLRENYSDVHVAAYRGDLEEVRAFLDMDVRLKDAVDETDYGDGYRPLHYAAYAGHIDVVKFLTSKGANVNAKNDAGCTPLFLACQQDREDVVAYLLKQRSRVDATVEGYSAVDVTTSEAVRNMVRGECKIAPPEGRVENVVACGIDDNERPGVLHVRWAQYRPQDMTGMSVECSGYVIRVRREGDGESEKHVAMAHVSSSATTSIRIPGVRVAGNLIADVAAKNSDGRGPFSDPSEPVRTTGKPEHPNKPTAIAASRTKVKVTWETPPSMGCAITRYELHMQVAPFETSEWVSLEKFPARKSRTQGETLSSLIPGTKYRFRVAAINAVGRSSFSPPSNAAKTQGYAPRNAPERASGKLKAVAAFRSAASSKFRVQRPTDTQRHRMQQSSNY